MTSPTESLNADPRANAQNAALDATEQLHLEQELRRAYLAQGLRPPLIEALALPVYGWVLSGTVHPDRLGVWLVFLFALMFLRWRVCVRGIHPDFPADKLKSQSLMLTMTRTAVGLTLGLGIAFWLHDMSEFGRTLTLAMTMGWFSTIVITSIAYPFGSIVFGICLTVPVSVSWLTHDFSQGLAVSVLAIAVLLVLHFAHGAMYRVLRGMIISRMHEESLSRHLEIQRAEQEAAIRAKSLFLAAASHDIRQPVTSMNLLLSAVHAASDEQSLRRVIAKFEPPLKALEEVLTSILEVSRLEAGITELKLRRCELIEILEPLISEYRSRAGAKHVQLESELPEVLYLETDPEILRRIIRNLLDNAVKFTEIGVVRILAEQKNQDLLIRVRDTGPGIPESQQHKVFDDYFQADNWHRDRRQGLGLGLSIVRRMVPLLNAQITLDSRPGHGSTFSLLLKGAVAQSQDHDDDDFSDDLFELQPGIEVESVLVVEDDKLVADALATVFSGIGVKARYAMDGEDALMQTALGRFIPDLAMVDFGLPGRYDGLTLIAHLKNRLPKCVFLLVTGDTNPEVLRRATDEGIPVLHKPITMNRLAEKLRQIGVRTD
jgi:signal transduction histidine kinase